MTSGGEEWERIRARRGIAFYEGEWSNVVPNGWGERQRRMGTPRDPMVTTSS